MSNTIEIVGKPIEELSQEEIIANLDTIHTLMIDSLGSQMCCAKTTKSGFIITVTAQPDSIMKIIEITTQRIVYSRKNHV